jgi:O-antigen/teichoic acid export membrane protein
MEKTVIRRIAANTAALFSSHLVIKIISFVYLIFLARHLGEKGLGQLAFAAAFAEIFNIFSDFGFSTVTVREVARRKDLSYHYLKNVLSLRLAISSLVFLAMIVVANLSGFSTEVLWAIGLYGLAQILLSFGSTFQSVLNAFEKMHYGSILSILSMAFISLTGFVFIHLGLGVVAFASLHLIWSLPLAIGYIYCGRRESIKLGIGFDFKFWREISISAIPVGLGAAFYVIYNRVDLIMLKYMKGDYDVGIYGIAYRMMGYFHFIIWALMGATAPVFSNSFAENRARLRSLAERCIRYLMFLGIPLAIGGSFLAKPIILFLYKDKFIQSSGVFSLLIFSIMIVFFGATFGTILLNSDKKGSRFYAVVAAGGVVLNVIMNLILIPKWTYYGAAAATLATDFFTSFLAFFYVVHLVGPLRIGSSLIKACLSSLIMVVGLYFLEPFNLRLPVLIVIGMVIYTLCAILFKFFQSRDMEVLKMVLLSPQSSSKEITE